MYDFRFTIYETQLQNQGKIRKLNLLNKRITGNNIFLLDSIELSMIDPTHKLFDVPEDVNRIIHKYFQPGTIVHKYYYTHCIKVTELCLLIVKENPKLKLNLDYILKGAMLHDIGIIKTNAPEIGCFGEYPYIAHTYLGRKILEEEGLPEIAPICERHLGTGLTINDIIESNFPLPHRDMTPKTLEEKLVCYADKFYSKSDKHLTVPKTPTKIRKKILKYGEDKLKTFEEFVDLFGIDYIYK